MAINIYIYILQWEAFRDASYSKHREEGPEWSVSVYSTESDCILQLKDHVLSLDRCLIYEWGTAQKNTSQ